MTFNLSVSSILRSEVRNKFSITCRDRGLHPHHFPARPDSTQSVERDEDDPPEPPEPPAEPSEPERSAKPVVHEAREGVCPATEDGAGTGTERGTNLTSDAAAGPVMDLAEESNEDTAAGVPYRDVATETVEETVTKDSHEDSDGHGSGDVPAGSVAPHTPGTRVWHPDMSPGAALAVSPVWPRLQIPERPASPCCFSLIGAATTPAAHATSLSWLSMWAGESRGRFWRTSARRRRT